MTNPTSNYNFQMPTTTDLVTDLPADFEVFGQAVDTRLKALQPGTTLGDLAYSSATANTNTRLGIGTSGQVLAVSGGGVPAWTTTADVTPLTTKGDLFTFTTVDARLGVGANNTVLTADSAEATGLKWATPASGGMTLLASGSITTTVSLTSIAQTYEQLMLFVTDFGGTGVTELKIRFNGDTSGIYGVLRVSGTNTTATTEMRNADTSIIVVAGDTAANSTNAHCVFTIPNYTAPAYKVATSIASSTADYLNENQIRMLTAAYRSATAISQIELVGCTAGNYELWGVK